MTTVVALLVVRIDLSNSSNSFVLEKYYGRNGICVEGNAQYWQWLAFCRCSKSRRLGGKVQRRTAKSDVLEPLMVRCQGEIPKQGTGARVGAKLQAILKMFHQRSHPDRLFVFVSGCTKVDSFPFTAAIKDFLLFDLSSALRVFLVVQFVMIVVVLLSIVMVVRNRWCFLSLAILCRSCFRVCHVQ